MASMLAGDDAMSRKDDNRVGPYLRRPLRSHDQSPRSGEARIEAQGESAAKGTETGARRGAKRPRRRREEEKVAISRKRASPEDRLVDLRGLDVPALRAAWADEFGRPAPARLGRDLLMRAIAYRIQERRGGGLRPATFRRLKRLAEDLQNGTVTEPAPPPPLSPGVRLMREWSGESHVVDVPADGFAWRGTDYASLSAIARAITGVRWSGPRFFGLLDKRPAKISDPFIRRQGNRP